MLLAPCPHPCSVPTGTIQQLCPIHGRGDQSLETLSHVSQLATGLCLQKQIFVELELEHFSFLHEKVGPRRSGSLAVWSRRLHRAEGAARARPAVFQTSAVLQSRWDSAEPRRQPRHGQLLRDEKCFTSFSGQSCCRSETLHAGILG